MASRVASRAISGLIAAAPGRGTASLIENELQLQFLPLSSPERTHEEPQMPPSRLRPVDRRPVYRHEAPIAELRVAEAFTVTALRLWAAPHRAPEQQHDDWRRGVVSAGTRGAGRSGFLC